MWSWKWMRRITTGSRMENEKRKIIFQIHEGSIQQQGQRPEPPGAGLVVFAWSIRVFIVLYGCDCAHARLFFRAIYGRQFRSRSIFWRWSEGLWFRKNRKVSGFNGNRRKPCRRFREKDSFCGEFWVRCFVTIYQVFFPDNSQMLDCHLFDDIRTGNQYQVAGTSTPAKQFPIMQRSIKSPGWISVQVPEEPVSILSFYIKGNIGLW